MCDLDFGYDSDCSDNSEVSSENDISELDNLDTVSLDDLASDDLSELDMEGANDILENDEFIEMEEDVVYEPPQDNEFEEIEGLEDIDEINVQENEQSLEELSDIPNEEELNIEGILGGMDQNEIAEGICEISPEAMEQIDATLGNFEDNNWENLQIDDQKETISELYEYVTNTLDLKNPPQIEYYNNEDHGDYGGYNPSTNTLRINEYMLNDGPEAADTVSHELWHAYQHEHAENPTSTRDFQYQVNFENYIPPALGQEAYENQLVEAEARAFASQFRDRIASIGGR